jgi:hypothetical protein
LIQALQKTRLLAGFLLYAIDKYQDLTNIGQSKSITSRLYQTQYQVKKEPDSGN